MKPRQMRLFRWRHSHSHSLAFHLQPRVHRHLFCTSEAGYRHAFPSRFLLFLHPIRPGNPGCWRSVYYSSMSAAQYSAHGTLILVVLIMFPNLGVFRKGRPGSYSRNAWEKDLNCQCLMSLRCLTLLMPERLEPPLCPMQSSSLYRALRAQPEDRHRHRGKRSKFTNHADDRQSCHWLLCPNVPAPPARARVRHRQAASLPCRRVQVREQLLGALPPR